MGGVCFLESGGLFGGLLLGSWGREFHQVLVGLRPGFERGLAGRALTGSFFEGIVGNLFVHIAIDVRAVQVGAGHGQGSGNR